MTMYMGIMMEQLYYTVDTQNRVHVQLVSLITMCVGFNMDLCVHRIDYLVEIDTVYLMYGSYLAGAV